MVLREVFKDPWTYVGSLGASMLIAIDWIATHFNPIMALMAGVGGFILILIGIREKIEKYKLAKKENKLKELQIEHEKLELERWRNQ